MSGYSLVRKRIRSTKIFLQADKEGRTAGFWSGNVHELHVERDELTSLPLRSSFCRYLQNAVELAALQAQCVAVIFIGLDHFKIINTIFGHQAGDAILKQVAQRLTRHLGADDFLARLGGDEFSLVLQNVPDREAAQSRAQRCLETIRESLFVDTQEITMTASVGVAIGPGSRPNCGALGLMEDADIAMASVKLGGRDRVAMHSPELAASLKGQAFGRYDVRQRLARLTPRESEVLQLLVEGHANKMIAFLLGNSNRTIENHRATIMRKMNAKSLPELVRMVIDP